MLADRENNSKRLALTHVFARSWCQSFPKVLLCKGPIYSICYWFLWLPVGSRWFPLVPDGSRKIGACILVSRTICSHMIGSRILGSSIIGSCSGIDISTSAVPSVSYENTCCCAFPLQTSLEQCVEKSVLQNTQMYSFIIGT